MPAANYSSLSSAGDTPAPVQLKEALSMYPELRVFTKRLFSIEECNRILEDLIQAPLEEGMVAVDTPPVAADAVSAVIPTFATKATSRQCLTSHHYRTADNEWIYKRMDELFLEVSNLHGLPRNWVAEPLKLVRYGVGDHFVAWHSDTGAGYTARRQLSMSVELSSREDFEGGVLEFSPPVNADSLPKQGVATVFSSIHRHRVSKIETGTRFVLVNWTSCAA